MQYKKIAILLLWIANVRGATAVEYGILMAAISVSIMLVIFSIGDGFTEIFETVSSYLQESL